MSDGSGTPGMHQPPDPAGLRRAPPAGPKCTRMRGLLRDYADDDLTPAQRRDVEVHVHECRVCAIWLARAEHEVLRLRRAFTGEPAVAPPGFAQGTVQRLLVETGTVETGIGADVGDGGRSVPPAGRAAQGPAAPRPATPQKRGRRRGSLLFALAPAIVLLGLALLFVEAQAEIERESRLDIVFAEDAWRDSGWRRQLLVAGDHVPPDGAVVVGSRGRAGVDWNDAKAQQQPAARFTLRSDSSLRMKDGAPSVVAGSVEIEANRPITVTVGDGSKLELGEGRYQVDATEFRSFDQPLLDAPDGIRVRLEVLSGEANIVRGEGDVAAVRVGEVGIYHGWSAVAISPSPSVASIRGGWDRTPAPPPTAEHRGVSGSVYESGGLASRRASVLLSFVENGHVAHVGVETADNGLFHVDTNAPIQGEFVVVNVQPRPERTDLGMLVPDAYRLLRTGQGARLTNALVLSPSPALVGLVTGDDQSPVAGARLLPCVIDELFGYVLPWHDGVATTDAQGRFLLRGLPASLPPHQTLALLAAHPDFEARLVPVPVPGSLASRVMRLAIELEPLRNARLVGLAPNQVYLLYEEVRDLPAGSAVRQYASIRTNWQGIVPSLHVGTGRLWYQLPGGGRPMVRQFVSGQGAPAGQVLLRPEEGPPRDIAAAFRQVHFVTPASVFLISSGYRHASFALPRAGSPAWNPADAPSGRMVAGTQVFGVAPSLHVAEPQVRFLGISDGVQGVFADVERDETLVVAIAPDGGIGCLEIGHGANNTIPLVATGSVLVAETLRPRVEESQQVVTLRFERTDEFVHGLQPVAWRFACAAENWEVRGLPPGAYTVRTGTRTLQALVTPGNVTTIR